MPRKPMVSEVLHKAYDRLLGNGPVSVQLGWTKLIFFGSIKHIDCIEWHACRGLQEDTYIWVSWIILNTQLLWESSLLCLKHQTWSSFSQGKAKQKDVDSNFCFKVFLMKNALLLPSPQSQLERSGYENNLKSSNAKGIFFSRNHQHFFHKLSFSP